MNCECQKKCKPPALSATRKGKGVVVWIDPKCLKRLIANNGPALLMQDESGEVMWLPVKLNAQGVIYVDFTTKTTDVIDVTNCDGSPWTPP